MSLCPLSGIAMCNVIYVGGSLCKHLWNLQLVLNVVFVVVYHYYVFTLIGSGVVVMH